ncbi:hypothetical protein N7532_007424 [Penicillium argentinense]|uniref:25S rRNA (uridine-N(3))-methyltransferase BMT5-like domain-containing protein n=1 Tax=Penicillium argentinense TaxID=1131581 RepID=A0A9W9F7P0_9EURO|nr:uncharacterized protein N7532_007424 [Penicillium argentinense]KAJ5095133.1 hypothetical protein N7532_007424 [Penicillium argentinense]
MPRKKQKGQPPRSNRPGPKPQGQGQGQGQQKAGKNANAGNGPQKLQPLQQNQRPIVPFLRGDRILLIGEGDFSFARSLATQYKCRKICATCYDSKETLYEKYPQAEQNIQDITSSKSKSSAAENEDENQDEEEEDSKESAPKAQSAPRVLFSIDARKLGAQGGGGKEIRQGFTRRERKIPAWKLHQQQQQGSGKGEETKPKPPSGPWDVICFNFPHVGGLSTDVNRQVRANQELLVSFFKSCLPLLSAAPEKINEDEEWDYDEDLSESDEVEDEDGDAQTTGKSTREGPGQILVSLFEGEPYTLWNIKDLARHAGLQVVTSFRFPWASYEGYSHARTLGEVEGKDGGRGGWRGEDRDARMYVFEVKKEIPKPKRKKRARDESSDSE